MERELGRPYILFGGDYNPDQWDEATIREDMAYFKKAKINTVTLPVFSWAKLEPEEGVYSFAWLDRILDILDEAGISYFLATPTSAQPAWLSRKYPEVLPVDIAGRRRTHGMRVFFCVNSARYRERAAALASRMAERYKNRRGLIGWHVANEYGTYCYCENCQRLFRGWLRRRYGSVEALNGRWSTAFWGRTLYSFDEVMVPSELNDDYRFNPAVQLDYLRFMTDSTAACYDNEARILKAATPGLAVFTNISGYIKKLDQFEMTAHMDCAGWDNYPGPRDEPSLPALKHDIMRAAKDGSSYYVMEQSPNQQNWQPYNKLKRPGELRRIAYQGLAHGSDSSLYFQLRQSAGGQEKFHGAVISHSGRDDTRIFGEIAQLGAELERLGDRFVCGRTQARAGILFDWNNWWALELASGPTKDMDYLREVHHYYRAFHEQNLPVDIVKFTGDFSGYRLLVAPMLYMLWGDIAARLEAFVAGGGTLIATYMSGIADENDRCVYGAYPGPLRRVFGLWVEETDALYPDEKNHIRMLPDAGFSDFGRAADNGCAGIRPLSDAGVSGQYSCGFLCDLVRLEGARALAVYTDDFYAGRPALTENAYGSGRAYYLASRFERGFLRKLIGKLAAEQGIAAAFPFCGKLELARRDSAQGSTWFVINHGGEAGEIDLQGQAYRNLLDGAVYSGRTSVAAGDVLVLAQEGRG